MLQRDSCECNRKQHSEFNAQELPPTEWFNLRERTKTSLNSSKINRALMGNAGERRKARVLGKNNYLVCADELCRSWCCDVIVATVFFIVNGILSTTGCMQYLPTISFFLPIISIRFFDASLQWFFFFLSSSIKTNGLCTVSLSEWGYRMLNSKGKKVDSAFGPWAATGIWLLVCHLPNIRNTTPNHIQFWSLHP